MRNLTPPDSYIEREPEEGERDDFPLCKCGCVCHEGESERVGGEWKCANCLDELALTRSILSPQTESQASRLASLRVRGYSCVGLFEPKNPTNVGCVLRAAGCFGVDLVAVQGARYRNATADTQKAWKHIPLIETDNLALLLPKGCIGVAVDIVEGATPLPRYTHPERAFYVFGGEDRTLDARVFSWCRDKVLIPSSFCLNLAAAVNVVLYDRSVKQA